MRKHVVQLVLVHEHELARAWRRSGRFAATIGGTGHALNEWVKKADADAGKRAGVSTDMAPKLKALERDNRDLRSANEIQRKASAYFAQAYLERRFQP